MGEHNSPSPDNAPLPGSQRHFERFGLDRWAKVTELDQFGNPGSSWRVRVVDLSRGGIGLRSRRMVHVNRSVIIELSGVEAGGTRILFGVVRQSRYAEGEGYAVGVQFRAMPTTSSVRHWLTSRGIAA